MRTKSIQERLMQREIDKDLSNLRLSQNNPFFRSKPKNENEYTWIKLENDQLR